MLYLLQCVASRQRYIMLNVRNIGRLFRRADSMAKIGDCRLGALEYKAVSGQGLQQEKIKRVGGV